MLMLSLTRSVTNCLDEVKGRIASLPSSGATRNIGFVAMLPQAELKIKYKVHAVLARSKPRLID